MLASEMAQYLAQEGLGTFNETGAGGTIFIGLLPQAPDQCLALIPTGGYPTPSSDPCDQVTIQIVARGTQDPRPSFQKIQSIYEKLQGFHNDVFVTGGYHIVMCQALQSAPITLNKDANGRYLHAINFLVTFINTQRQ